jgi:hypothetical protein
MPLTQQRDIQQSQGDVVAAACSVSNATAALPIQQRKLFEPLHL